MTRGRKTIGLLLFGIAAVGQPATAHAARSSIGRTLAEPANARAVALAEAYTAASNDVAGFGYNPGSLKSLKRGQASFLFERGAVDDVFGRFMIGAPLPGGAGALSLGHYNTGEISLYDGRSRRTVVGQSDLTVSAGYGGQAGPLLVGGAVKYLSSTLVGTVKAAAYAADFGVQLPARNGLRLGAAVQNIGTSLRYVNESAPLPRMARVGAAVSIPFQLPTTMFLDLQYPLVERDLRPALGVESVLGPLALRMGARKKAGTTEFSMGFGVGVQSLSLDYSFGLMNDARAQQQISLSVAFGSPLARASEVSSTVPSKPNEPMYRFDTPADQITVPQNR